MAPQGLIGAPAVTTQLPRGVLLAFEGIDGSGKSTQARLMADWAEARGLEVVRTREPTHGPWGQKIRNARFTARLSPEDELAAFMADRQEHVTQVLRPALARGALVVIDRYYYSTVAYQGARGFDPKVLLAQNRAFAPVPDMVVLVDVDPHVSLARIQSRGEGQDLFENLSQLSQVRALFLSLTDAHITLIDGNRAEEVVFTDVLRHVCAGPLANLCPGL